RQFRSPFCASDRYSFRVTIRRMSTVGVIDRRHRREGVHVERQDARISRGIHCGSHLYTKQTIEVSDAGDGSHGEFRWISAVGHECVAQENVGIGVDDAYLAWYLDAAM